MSVALQGATAQDFLGDNWIMKIQQRLENNAVTDLENAETMLLSLSLNLDELDSDAIVMNLKYAADLIQNARSVYEADREVIL